MYSELLPYLRCVRCTAATLELDVRETDLHEIVAGTVRCTDCGGSMPIVDGILDALIEPLPRVPAQLVNYSAVGAWGYERLWRWQALSLLSGQRFPLRDELRLVRGLMQPDRGGLIVDAACSTALYGRALVAPDAVVASVDHAWAMLREARRFARHEGKRISCVRASAQFLPFQSGSASGYAIGGSLNEIGDIDAMLREARRVVHDDGRFVTMHLSRATTIAGRLLQRGMATGGIVFPTDHDLGGRFQAAGWRRMAHWQWRVVNIDLLIPGL